MSCQVKVTASICDIASIRRCLFPLDDSRGSESWLQCCELSVSPTGDIFGIAHEKRLVVLTSKWDIASGLCQFRPTFSETVLESENITSILCLPIVSQSQSSQVGPDWICIVLGFESGFVRFYTEDCTLLFEEQLHNENVVSLKCQSQHSPRPDINVELRPEELYVHFPSNICIVNGSNLFTTLRNCRLNLTRSKATGTALEPVVASMNPKKWGFVDQPVINDVAVVGLDLSNTFDHLLTASTCGGFDSRYRAMAPHNNLVLGAGTKPFLGFHYALEGGAQPVLTDVAKAVASKLKSALPGWLTGTRQTPEKQTSSVSTHQSEPMACRFGLCDVRRTANNVILSPDKRLAAVTDALGRVVLVDTHLGTAVRIFKGYRDATCSFIQVPDERKTKHRSTRPVALFLVVYSPRKGTLEIFSAEIGTKIATFAASKSSRLIYINYGLMGFQNTSKSRYLCQYTCLLIDNDGQVKDITIPFHFSLPEKNSKRSRDLHLYKRLKQFIRIGEYDNDSLVSEAVNTCNELKTTEVKLQLLDLLINSKEIIPDVMLKCAERFIEKINALNTNEIDADVRTLRIFSENIIAIVNFYVYVTEESDEWDAQNGNIDDHSGPLDTRLNLGAREITNLQRLLDLSTLNEVKSSELQVTFADNCDHNLSKFLSIFNLNDSDVINIKSDCKELSLFEVAEMTFKRFITTNVCDGDVLRGQIERSKIIIGDLFRLLLIFWVNRPLNIDINLEKEMRNLSDVIYASAQNVSANELIVAYNQTSPFWTTVREILVNSSRPFPALMAAILCKSVAQRVESQKELERNSEDDLEVWENLSQENCQWTLLIGKLEDVSLLNIILANDPVNRNGLPKLKHEESRIVSLKYILEKGRGSVSELVARWLTIGGVNSRDLVLNDLIYQRKSIEEDVPNSSELEWVPNIEGVSEEDLKNIKSQTVFEHLNTLKKQFPYSLQAGVLLANMSWEYALSWQKNIQVIDNLEACVSCLAEITNPHIRQGLYNLVWNAHLKITLEGCCKLVNKIGRLPKERLCRQDTGLTDFQVTLFVRICADFFDSFMDTTQICFVAEKIQLHYEPIWEDEGFPLTELALNQNQINYDLLLLHYQLSLTLQMIATFSIKHSKFINNLYDPSVTQLFFADLQQKTPQINWHKSESRTNASRVDFLVKVISATIETVTVNEGRIYATDHVNWMGKCLSLARFWNLDVDFFRRYQVVQLFSNGFDSLADEVLTAVSDTEKLGPDLLEVAGRRLSQLLASSRILGEKIAAFSTTLTQYLDTLNGEWCAPSSLDATLLLGSHSLRCLSEDQPEHKLAKLLIDACATLQDMES